MARLVAAALTVCALLFSSSAFADAGRLGLQLLSTVSGKERPAIIIQPRDGVRSLVVTLTRNDGKKQRLQAINVAAGTKKKLAIRQEFGRFSYNAQFAVKWAAGKSSEFGQRFTMTRVDKLKLLLKPENVDLDGRSMSFSINNPGKKAELEIIGQKRQRLALVSKDISGLAAGSDVTLKWKDFGEEILYMDLKVYDVAGFWKGVRLTPFSISIPHDDVEFQTAKWTIRPSEEHKLKATMKQIREALDKHGTLLQLKLYVGGYTDTVGSKAANRTLSNNRARSIASWFRAHGLRIPIFYQGFGEEALAKPTPDETEEAANRRALYILSTQIPTGGSATPTNKWRPL